jgi:methylated-DNA-[protein]-cysteine S-methyltransferase
LAATLTTDSRRRNRTGTLFWVALSDGEPEATSLTRLVAWKSGVAKTVRRYDATIMRTTGFALFDTEIGRCGLAWGPRGIVGACLPEASDDAVRARFRRRYSEAMETAPPAEIRRVCDAVVALTRGEPVEFTDVTLDMDGVPDLNRQVYDIALRIPPGATLTYGEIAARMGQPDAARAVGVALGQNPFPPIVPCHRILMAGGRIGGFSAPGGIATKRKLLAIESVLAKASGNQLSLI